MKYHRRRGRLRWYFIGRAIRETDVRGEDKCPAPRRPRRLPGYLPFRLLGVCDAVAR